MRIQHRGLRRALFAVYDVGRTRIPHLGASHVSVTADSVENFRRTVSRDSAEENRLVSVPVRLRVGPIVVQLDDLGSEKERYTSFPMPAAKQQDRLCHRHRNLQVWEYHR